MTGPCNFGTIRQCQHHVTWILLAEALDGWAWGSCGHHRRAMARRFERNFLEAHYVCDSIRTIMKWLCDPTIERQGVLRVFKLEGGL